MSYQLTNRSTLGCIKAVLFSGVLAFATPALPDAVTDWNAIADATSVAAGGPPVRARITAMTHLAIHDALNSIAPRYASYTSIPSADSAASPQAAVAAAAHVVLSQTVPSQAGNLMQIYQAWVSSLPPCPAIAPTCIERGKAAGETAAYAILAQRHDDGSATPHLPYTLSAAPGIYQPTPPAFAAPQFAGWALLEPFALETPSQFRAEPSELFDLTSERYARDFAEVKRVGHVDAEINGQRTADQSAIARYWPGGGANWNGVTRVIVAQRGLDLWQHAHLFALLNVALSDSAVATFDTKYHYNFWRPVTAIRAADSDGNPATVQDPTWQSYQPTPPYPDYTCGLTTNTGAAVEVLRRYFRTDAIGFTFTAGGITRSYESLSQAAAEAVDARVFGGMHFRSGCVQGVRQGEQVGRFVINHMLEPRR